MKKKLKPSDLLHELEQGERIDEDLKKFLTGRTFTTSGMGDWMFASTAPLTATSVVASTLSPWVIEDDMINGTTSP